MASSSSRSSLYLLYQNKEFENQIDWHSPSFNIILPSLPFLEERLAVDVIFAQSSGLPGKVGALRRTAGYLGNNNSVNK